MKRLLLILLLLATTAHAVDESWTWQQKAGITCLAGAGLLAATHHEEVKEGADNVKKFVKRHPGKIMISLTTLGVVLLTDLSPLADNENIKGLTGLAKLLTTIQKLFTFK